MNTKNTKLIWGIVFLVLLILALRWFGFIPQGSPQATFTSRSSASASSPSPSSVPKQLSPEEIQIRSEAQVQYQNHVLELLSLTPIVFYGKVVDQNGIPIGGANAAISPSQSPNSSVPDIDKTTDENGLFSVTTHGLGIAVTVTKNGYYATPESGGVFGYSVATGGDYKPHTDSRDPAIFVLQKMGETEPLIRIQRYVKIPKDGTPTFMNIASGRTYELTNGDIQVQAWTNDKDVPPNGYHPYNWRCKITVPGGGLEKRAGGEFDFMAPENGYEPSDEIDMPIDTPQWSRDASRSYYLHLSNGTFARIDFKMAAEGDHFFSITSFLNPQPGHRNLEYDPVKQINK